MEAPRGTHHWLHPAHLTPPTFLVLYSDKQMETEEMRKMHRAYQ